MNSPAAFKCQFCGKYFSKKSNCTTHIKNVHNRNLNGDPILDRARESFTCELCDKKFAAKRNLENHITVVHLLNSKSYTCSKCTFKTVHQSNLNRHILKIHQNKQEISDTFCSIQYFKCSKCTAKFKEERQLKYHERKSHKLGVAIPTIRKCPICPFVSKQKNKFEIHDHFEKIHDVHVRQKHYSFDTIEQFHSWKNETERITTTSYVKHGSTKTCAYYQCHRSGHHRTKGHLKRAMKMSGSCKINGFCPASIAMKIKKNKVQVSYISMHVGHKNCLKYIRLSNEERRSIALQLASKKPHEEILKSIRGSIHNADLRRIHLANKKDIVNIENSLNLHDESIKHPFNPITIASWVKDFSNLCIHEYVCSYMDKCIKNNVCKHIHAVAKSEIKDDSFSSKQAESSNEMKQLTIDCEFRKDQEQNNILTQITQPNNKKPSLEQLQLKIHQECDSLIRHITNIEQAFYVQNEIKKMKTTLEAMNLSSTSMSTLKVKRAVPGNTNTINQRKCKTTKVKKVKKVDTDTVIQERQALALQLLTDYRYKN